MENISPIQPVKSMMSINPINYFPISRLQLENKPISAASDPTQNANRKNTQQTSPNPLETLFLQQLPEGPVNEMADIIRHISTSTYQAAELEPAFKNRELLQSEINKDILNLKTVLKDFSPDDMKLFAALFQNQPPIGFSFSDSNQSSSLNSFPEDGSVKNFPENLFGIDVTSKSGLFSAFDITGTITEILSGRNSGTSLLEPLLDNLSNSIFNFPAIDTSGQDQNSSAITRNLAIARLLTQSRYFSPGTADSKTQTIIDLIG